MYTTFQMFAVHEKKKIQVWDTLFSDCGSWAELKGLFLRHEEWYLTILLKFN